MSRERGTQNHTDAQIDEDIGGFEEDDALVEGSVNNRPCRRVVDPSPDFVAADADHRDLEAADRSRLHAANPMRPTLPRALDRVLREGHADPHRPEPL